MRERTVPPVVDCVCWRAVFGVNRSESDTLGGKTLPAKKEKRKDREFSA